MAVWFGGFVEQIISWGKKNFKNTKLVESTGIEKSILLNSKSQLKPCKLI